MHNSLAHGKIPAELFIDLVIILLAIAIIAPIASKYYVREGYIEPNGYN